MSKTLRKNQLRKSVAKTKKYILYGGTASINIDYALRNFAIIKPEATNLQKYIDSDHDFNTLKKYIILNPKLPNHSYGYLFITPPNYKNTDTTEELVMKIKAYIKERNYPEVFLGVKVGSKWELKKLEHKKGNVYIYTGDPKTEIKTYTQVLQPKTSSVVSMSETEHYKKAPSNVKTNIKKASKRKGVMSRMFKCFGAESCNESDSEEDPTSHRADATTSHGVAPAAPAHGPAAAPAAPVVEDEFNIVVVKELVNTFEGYTQEEIIDFMLKIFQLTKDEFNEYFQEGIYSNGGNLMFKINDDYKYQFVMIDNCPLLVQINKTDLSLTDEYLFIDKSNPNPFIHTDLEQLKEYATYFLNESSA